MKSTRPKYIFFTQCNDASCSRLRGFSLHLVTQRLLARGPSTTVRFVPENLTFAPLELGCSPSAASRIPALAISSLNFPIAASSSLLGRAPASESLFAFTIAMNRILVLLLLSLSWASFRPNLGLINTSNKGWRYRRETAPFSTLANHAAKQRSEGRHDLWQTLQTPCIFREIRLHSLPAKQEDWAQYPQRQPCRPLKKVAPVPRPAIKLIKQSRHRKHHDGHHRDPFQLPRVCFLPFHVSLLRHFLALAICRTRGSQIDKRKSSKLNTPLDISVIICLADYEEGKDGEALATPAYSAARGSKLR